MIGSALGLLAAAASHEAGQPGLIHNKREDANEMDYGTKQREAALRLLGTITPRFSARMRSVGNPDFGQYAPVSEPETITAHTLDELVTKAREYRQWWNMGSGNWTNPTACEDGEPVGRIMFNGAVRDMDYESPWTR